jgi:hypothetical protein
MRDCITHHHACDCREAKFSAVHAHNGKMREALVTSLGNIRSLTAAGKCEMFDCWAGVVADALVPPTTAYANHDRCGWAHDEAGVWQTDCGGSFLIEAGNPQENDMRFCCYCGRPVK